MSTPLVSAVIPVFNAGKYLAVALESVLGQTYPHVEIVAVNDGSTDDSREILSAFEPRIRVVDQANAGPSVARNAGVRQSSGALIAFLDSDDLWDRHKLARQVEMMLRFPEAVAVYCDVRRIDASGQVLQRTEALDRAWHSGQVFASLLTGRLHNNMTPSQVMVTRHAFDRAGGFPEGVRHSEDYGLWLRMALDGPFLYCLETLVSYRRHPDSLSVEHDAAFGQLGGRFAALLGVRERVLQLAQPATRRVYLHELHHAALTMGWFCRQRGEHARAADAYRIASECDRADLKARLAELSCRVRAALRRPRPASGGDAAGHRMDVTI